MSDEEFAILRRLVAKQGREEAQMTVTPVDSVQHCSPCPFNPQMPPDVRMRLESNESKMVRVFKHPDSSVPQTRGHGRQDEPPPTVS